MTEGQEDELGATFGARVKKARERLGLTQQQLADRLRAYGWKIDTSGITRIENGSRDLRLSEAEAVASAFGLALADLIPPAPSELVVAKLRRDLDHAKMGLIEMVEEYGAARRALSQALDDLDAHGVKARDYEVMRAEAGIRAIADWSALKADILGRYRTGPIDETIFDAEA